MNRASRPVVGKVLGLNPNAVTLTHPNKWVFLMQMFTVYILYSEILNGFYIGYTAQDVQERLRKHLANHKGHTAKAKDWVIAYIENFQTKQEAMQREKQLKSWKSNIRITKLINRNLNE